jgi:deoxyribonuclease-1
MRILLICLLALASGAAPAEASGYRDIIPAFWAKLYPDGGEDLYCGQRFERYQRWVNIEHVYPMAWVTRALGCVTRQQCRERSPRFNEIEADMHNLYPAIRKWNDARGAMAYGEIAGEDWVSRSCDLEIDPRRRRVEPREVVRGDIARAMLYMEARYGLEIYARQRALLLDWHHADPPDDHERWRNGRIEQLQGSRNPFIDQPETLH